MRCRICDVSSMGLSDYRTDRVHAGHFHTLPSGDVLCDECYYEGEEVLSDFALEDTEREEEDGAFDYD